MNKVAEYIGAQRGYDADDDGKGEGYLNR